VGEEEEKEEMIKTSEGREGKREEGKGK